MIEAELIERCISAHVGAYLGKSGNASLPPYPDDRKIVETVLQATGIPLAVLAALAEGKAKVIKWPPSGEDVKRVAEKIAPHATDGETWRLAVETACDAIDAYVAAAPSSPAREDGA